MPRGRNTGDLRSRANVGVHGGAVELLHRNDAGKLPSQPGSHLFLRTRVFRINSGKHRLFYTVQITLNCRLHFLWVNAQRLRSLLIKHFCRIGHRRQQRPSHICSPFLILLHQRALTLGVLQRNRALRLFCTTISRYRRTRKSRIRALSDLFQPLIHARRSGHDLPDGLLGCKFLLKQLVLVLHLLHLHNLPGHSQRIGHASWGLGRGVLRHGGEV